jgi:CBS domain containing-hemolysin-like protein
MLFDNVFKGVAVKKFLLKILYVCAYLGGLVVSFGLIVAGTKSPEYADARAWIGFLILVVTSILFVIWIIRGIIQWIARTAKGA